jgi:hypothetical protein
VSGLSSISAGSKDHLFVHSIGFSELSDLLVLAMSRARQSLPMFHILLRRDLDEIVDDKALYARFVGSLCAFRQQRLWPKYTKFYTDTEQLTNQYSAVSGINFKILPIPFDQCALETALAERNLAPRNSPLVVGYLGDARSEKGYQQLPRVVDMLMRSHILSGQIKFRFQSNYNLAGGEAGISEARLALSGYARNFVELLQGPLEKREYYRQLAEMDIILVPYMPERYARRSSGIFVQTMAAGKVAVIPGGTTMSAHRHIGPRNWVVYSESEELATALSRAVADFDYLSQIGTEQRFQWCSKNSVKTLVDRLLYGAAPGSAG